ncbi:MAG: transposase [Planctomycetes bacterium]|nr:transposase [Planctomycetota bacterium]
MVDRFTAPLAYHLTFTTYGTWLHGDERGSVDRKSASSVKKYVAPDPVLNEHMAESLRHPKVLLNASARDIVKAAVEDYCEFKCWPLLALNVRTNHVHLVVKAVDQPSKMLNAVKARATRLLREAGEFEPTQPIWTERGNKGRLLTQKAVNDAIDYVNNQQGPSI